MATMAAQLQFAELRAPFAGNITEQLQYQGDLGQPSGVIFTLVDMSVVSARAQVPEGEAAQIKAGQACSFKGSEESSTDAGGRVTVINRAVDAQRRTVEVWCEIGHPPQSLRAGSFGSVAFNSGGKEEVIVVPVTALQLEEGTRKGVVMVIDEKNVAHKREVEVGEITGNKRIVLKGLKAGEGVIIEGGYEMPEGTQVKTGAEKPEPAK